MSDDKNVFINDTLTGKASVKDMEKYIDAWHSLATDVDLLTFLGFSQEEYGRYLTTPGLECYQVVQSIIDKYKAMKDALDVDRSASIDSNSRPIIKTNR
jgi:hypothetical protein